MEAILKVRDICGTKVVTREDGKKINKKILDAWDSERKIVVDFENIPIASVSFLDQAIGILVLSFNEKTVREKLHLLNMSSFDAKLLEDIMISREHQRRKEATKDAVRGHKVKSQRRRKVAN
jgi:hypothetical protein